MRARAPLDVDLEDKLLYGLTPMRLAYLVIGLLCGYALWSSPWAPSAARAVACFAVAAIGAASAWGRWRGRPADAWVTDISIFVVNTHRVQWNVHWARRPKRRPTPSPPMRPSPKPIALVVAGRTPKAGASTVACELAACFAAMGHADNHWSVRVVPELYDDKPPAAGLLVSVVGVDAGRVCYLDSGAGPFVAGHIPEDESVRQAAALNQPTVVAFPDALASKAFRALADVIAAAG